MNEESIKELYLQLCNNEGKSKFKEKSINSIGSEIGILEQKLRITNKYYRLEGLLTYSLEKAFLGQVVEKHLDKIYEYLKPFEKGFNEEVEKENETEEEIF